jgi:hypothetical protein
VTLHVLADIRGVRPHVAGHLGRGAGRKLLAGLAEERLGGLVIGAEIEVDVRAQLVRILESLLGALGVAVSY